MTFNPRRWHPIAVALSVLNIAGAGFAAGGDEPAHAAVHVAFAVAFWFWARRLRLQAAGDSRLETPIEASEGLAALEDEVSRLREELVETQERLDFTERMLAQRADPRRVSPEPGG